MSNFAVLCGKYFRNILHNNKLTKLTYCFKESKRSCYVVLLPEVPPDTPESNPLLRTDDLPQFSQLTPEKCFNAIGKRVIDFETGLVRIEEKLQDENYAKTYDSVMRPIEELEVPFSISCNVLHCLSLVRKDTWDYSKLLYKLRECIQKAQSKQYQSVPIFNAVKVINASQADLTSFQKRMVAKQLQESHFSGNNFSESEQDLYKRHLTKLSHEQMTYSKKVVVTAERFQHIIAHENLMRKFPSELVAAMAYDRMRPSDGPWVLTLDSNICDPFMQYCEDRILRYKVWYALNTRASYLEEHFYNSQQIEEIRDIRLRIAKLFEFETYADMNMGTRMLDSLPKIQSTISQLHTKMKPIVEQELIDLQEFALENNFNGQLELWDVPYWSRVYRDSLYGVDSYEVSQYFPLETVLKGLFDFCHTLFDISIKEIDVADDVKPHSDARVYQIANENGEVVAKFYFDPFSRPGKKTPENQFVPIRFKSAVADVQPLSYLIMNIRPPILRNAPLLTFEDVDSLFQKFGTLLQHSLTISPYQNVAGINNLEWDVTGVVPNFMSYWVHHYETVRDVSGHVQTGEKLPLDLHQKLVKRSNHMDGFKMTTELYKSALDLELHTKEEFWDDVMKRIWPEYMPFPLVKDDCHPCSFHEIFTGVYGSRYFGLTWAKVVAADVFSGFQEAGLNNKEHIKELGKRFRDTFLKLGGSCHSSEVFRQFRGRDPSIDPLLVMYDLKRVITEEKIK